MVEPKTRHVKLDSPTLRTPEDVRAWITTTERELPNELEQGPVMIG